MFRGITPIIAVILLLLITIALVGVASVFFGRTVQQAAAAGGQQTQEMVEQAGVQFAIEAVNKNKVSLRNLGQANLQVSGLSFYVNNAKIDTDSPAIPPGETRVVTLNDAQLSMQPDPAELRVSAGGYSDRTTADFYGKYTVAYWTFDEGSGASASDSAGTATLEVRSLVNWVDGKYGKAVQMDPAIGTDCINQNAGVFGENLPDEIRNLPSQSFTLSWWNKLPQNIGQSRILLAAVDVPDCGRCSIWNVLGNSVIRTAAQNTNDIHYTSPAINEWHHFVFVFDKASLTAKMFIDDSQAAAGQSSLTPGGNYGSISWIGIGVYRPNCVDSIPGEIIDDVRILNVARSMAIV